MELWVVFAFVAATTQTLRSAGQKQMKSVIGDFGASYIRFSYALPFAALWLWIWASFHDLALPETDMRFWFWVSLGGLAQVIFTFLLLTLFNHRNFAAGTAFSKTEVLQAAIFEALIIGEIVSFQVGIAIFIGVMAILMLSFHKSELGLSGLYTSLLSPQTDWGWQQVPFWVCQQSVSGQPPKRLAQAILCYVPLCLPFALLCYRQL